ncbi:MAG: RHS repeat-associated core domain-containing protein [Silvibacterium sp.]
MQVAYRAQDGTTYFEHQDWLNTTRMRTDYEGNIAGTFTSLPFGDGSSSTLNKAAAGQDNTHFADLDLDNETNTDHATFRQYGNIQGRWMSPDHYSGSYDSSNPQSMDRYSYVLNDPLVYVDPDGTSQTQCGTNYCITPDPSPPGPDPCDDYSCFGPSGPGGGTLMPFMPIQGMYGQSVVPSNADVPNNNPCARAGGAPDTSVYQAIGNSVRSAGMQPGPVAAVNVTLQNGFTLASFHRGGSLDAQASGGSTSYANYVYGVYAGAAGMSLSQALQGADLYAAIFASYGPNVPLDPNYTSTPATNVAIITAGFNAQQNGTVCHK